MTIHDVSVMNSRYFDIAFEDYMLQHIDAESDYMHRLWRAINLQLYNGHMTSDHLQGSLLRMLVRMVRPHRVLEVGTFGGYSALSMAAALTDDAHLYTFDSNDELEPFTRRWIEGAPYASRITYMVGDAVQVAPRLGEMFDMVFLDGDKRTYVEAYEMAMGITTPDALIVADNTLWSGNILNEAYAHDRQTQGVKAFNDHVAADMRVSTFILPFRDGMTLLKKKEEGS